MMEMRAPEDEDKEIGLVEGLGNSTETTPTIPSIPGNEFINYSLSKI
jgi:hypothetical protein